MLKAEQIPYSTYMKCKIQQSQCCILNLKCLLLKNSQVSEFSISFSWLHVTRKIFEHSVLIYTLVDKNRKKEILHLCAYIMGSHWQQHTHDRIKEQYWFDFCWNSSPLLVKSIFPLCQYLLILPVHTVECHWNSRKPWK